MGKQSMAGKGEKDIEGWVREGKYLKLYAEKESGRISPFKWHSSIIIQPRPKGFEVEFREFGGLGNEKEEIEKFSSKEEAEKWIKKKMKTVSEELRENGWDFKSEEKYPEMLPVEESVNL